MNKELYKKNYKELKELNKLYNIIKTIENFLKENEKKFTFPESLDALKKIRDYLELKQKEYEEHKNKQRGIYKELYNTCKHEISIKYSQYPSYQCLICEQTVGVNREIIPEVSLLSIDITNDYKVARIIEEKFNEVLNCDLDLVEEMTNLIEDLQYDRDIKVYRRKL